MSDVLKIKVAIADRLYPLTVRTAEEEEGIRRAAKKINSLIAEYTRNYAVSDRQDALAMSALHFASLAEVSEINLDKKITTTAQKLKELNEQIIKGLS